MFVQNPGYMLFSSTMKALSISKHQACGGGRAQPAKIKQLPPKRSGSGLGKMSGISSRVATVNLGTDPASHATPITRHQTDRSLTVIRRRMTAELLDLSCLAVSFLASGGRSPLQPMFVSSDTSLDLAVRRLAKAGLIAYRRPRGQPPILTVTEKGHTHGSEPLWPERFWNRPWNGHWYVLMYDVPETERGYRCALERFFHRERMGYLQKSVWISARDIRPLFDDLDQAAAIRDYAILLEASPVLGQSPKQLAAQAWDFDDLAKRQVDYLDACAKRMKQTTGSLKLSSALDAARGELFDYLVFMQSDPLLPRELLPANYAGTRVVGAFRNRIKSLIGRLFSL
jgi:phenylacetic acid degradation operon negative regulatory protein